MQQVSIVSSMDPQRMFSLAWDKIVQEIKRLRSKNMTYEAIGEMMGGVKAATVMRWEKAEPGRGGQKTAAVDLFRYMDGLGLSLVDISDQIEKSDFGYVPKVKAKLGAGASLEINGEVEQIYAFRKDFLKHLAPKSRDLVLFEVRGDSMRPTLEDGDTVLIHQGDKDVVSGKLYACRVGNELMVKKLLVEPGKLRVVSENSAHGEFSVSLAEGAQEDFTVIGRVRWIGRVV
ncbi:MAG: helix-turn-helix transcriptional regulator [Desulfovibrio sp.]